MDILDADGSDSISYHEFIAAMLDRKHYTTDASCLAVFRIFDSNGDGKINRQELQQAMNSEELAMDMRIFPAIEE
ncbi:CPK3, partial [Symbiodinium pilosum]